MQSTIRLSRIKQGKNPREYFDPQEMAELEAGLRPYGVLQPILVRPLPASDEYEIVAGERRWRAAKNVFGDEYDMPVHIVDMSDGDAEAAALIENVHRANMSVAEEAKAAKRLLYRNRNDKSETARQFGWSVDKLECRLALNACTEEVLRALTERRILTGHAELLAGLPGEMQSKVLKNLIGHHVPVATLKAQLAQFSRQLAGAIFDTAVCQACPHNSAKQAALFGEALGEGYCQHPTHFDELTAQVIEDKAATLKDEYQVVKIIRPEDGFEPLRVTPDGDLGVGAEQYDSCKGCKNFGCSVSNMPGTYGLVTQSLCFDSVCHTQKLAAKKQAEREERQKTASSRKPASASKPHAGGDHKPKPANQTPQRVLQYRAEQWRKWLAASLMVNGSRNQRVLIALALAGKGSTLSADHYADAAAKITQGAKVARTQFRAVLEAAHGYAAQHVESLMKAATASAAFGVDQMTLEILLNYMQVDEARHFRLNQEFLDLFTKTELDSIASELKLKKALGEQFKKLRDGKRDEFIHALLTVKGFDYTGVVPAIMRYPRKALHRPASDSDAPIEGAAPDAAQEQEAERQQDNDAAEPAQA